jgi:hypothetical protein
MSESRRIAYSKMRGYFGISEFPNPDYGSKLE